MHFLVRVRPSYVVTILDGVRAGHPAVGVGVGRQRGARDGGRRGRGLGIRAADLAQGAVPPEIECPGSVSDNVLQMEIRVSTQVHISLKPESSIDMTQHMYSWWWMCQM